MTDSILVIGAGPAGLAAAHEAVRHGVADRVDLIEQSGQLGGLARTEQFRGHRFDVGPHRFFTQNAEIAALFAEICGDERVLVRRLTRIYYRGRFFLYPLTIVNALAGMGPWASIAIMASYARARLARLFAAREPVNFEAWVIDRFGRRLFETFFKTYTEKVWGIACTAISVDWAAQRIKGLSLCSAIRLALGLVRRGEIRSMIDEFHYPRLGAGQFYERMADRLRAAGGRVHLGERLIRLHHAAGRITGVEIEQPDGTILLRRAQWYLSSAPLTETIEAMHPPAPPEVLAAARSLRFRDHISVQLIVAGANPFDDNWIYVHSPDVRVARVANYANFSGAMAGQADRFPVTAEYFCFRDEPIWGMSDADLIDLATQELTRMDLIRPGCVETGYVIRSASAYPVIDLASNARVAILREFISGFQNFVAIGRAGLFKYNNQDHAMATGLLGMRRALGAGQQDPWLVNIDARYHEEAVE